MRILDRYLLKSLAVPLLCCLAAFTMVFVVFDLFSHLDDFLQGGAGLGRVLVFYAWVVPPVLVYISPISMMLSTLYCLTQLAKNSELTAMRSCGVSSARMAAPLLAVGAALAGLTAVVHETLAPEAAYRSRQFIRIQRAEDKRLARMAPNLAYRNEAQGRTWMIRHFDTERFDLHDIEILEMTPGGLDRRKITASRASWSDGRWWFYNVLIREYDEYGSLQGLGQRLPRREMAEFNERPGEFLTLVKDPRFLSARELRGYLAAHPALSREAVAHRRVDFHSRLAMPWMTLIVTLLSIPFAGHTARKGALAGILLALLVFFGYWILVHLGAWAGKQSLVPPALAGWGPNLLFLALGAGLFARHR